MLFRSRTVARGVAPDRGSLVKLALREYAAQRDREATGRGAMAAGATA